MCFPRRPELGCYNGSRADWQKAYRAARVSARAGGELNPKHSGIKWKAGLIVAHDRRDWVDPLVIPVMGRLEARRIIASLCDVR